MKQQEARFWEVFAVIKEGDDLFRGALLHWALKIIIILAICYLKLGLVIRTNKLFIHTFLIPWYANITGPEKI